MRRLLLAVVVTAAACAPAPDSPSTTVAPLASSTTTTTAPPAEGPPPVCLAGEDPFFQEGSAGATSRTRTDAAAIGAVRWEVHEGCERVEVGLTTGEGAPAVDPPTVASFLIRSAGVLRVTLGREVAASAIAEQLIDTDLVDRAFVVRAADGSLFVDLHLAAPAFARVRSASGPARVVVDLQPGGPAYRHPPARQGDVIVVEPAGGVGTYPLAVSGYVRTGDREVSGTLTGAAGERATTSSPVGDQADAWGSFVLLFADGPIGPVDVAVAGAVTVTLVVG